MSEDSNFKNNARSNDRSNVIYIEEHSNDASQSEYANISRSVSSNAQVASNPTPQIVSFHRTELDKILNVYSFKVAEGVWRDYAIDMLKERAIFSIYKNSRDIPIHCIEKTPKNARKQGMYSVTGVDGRILKRGHDLETILKVFKKSNKTSEL